MACEVSIDAHEFGSVFFQPVFWVAECRDLLFYGSQFLAAWAIEGEFVAEGEGFALQVQKFHFVGVFDLEFWGDLDEVGVGFGQLDALEVEEVVVFVGGEDFLLDCEIVQVKQAHRAHR